MPRTQAFGYYAQNFVGLSERIAEPDLAADPDLPRERLWQMRAREVVLATGAIERPLVFPDNDRPAVMLAHSARRYASQYGASVGERVVVATAHDSAYRAALDLKKAGVGVAQIVDLRPEAEGSLADAARAAGIEIIAAAAILGVQGRLRVKAVRIKHPGGDRTLACDALLMSGGWTPSVHLFSQSRGKLAFDEALQLFKPGASAQRERSAGACNAAFDLAGALNEGDAAGRAAAAAAGFAVAEARTYAVSDSLPASGASSAVPSSADRRSSRESLRRFPERRLRQGCEPGGAGRHALDRAHQALHHDRHGDRPGQALQHERARHRRRDARKADPRSGSHHLPAALYAGDLRRLRRPRARRHVRSHPPHADPRLGGRKRRQVRGRGPMEARLVFSAAQRVDARRRRARMPHDARERRPV